MKISITRKLKETHKKIKPFVCALCVNKIGFLTTVFHPMCHQTCIHIEDHTSDMHCNKSDKAFRLCNENGHAIVDVECNLEFKLTMDLVIDNMNVDVNCTNTQDHVSTAE